MIQLQGSSLCPFMRHASLVLREKKEEFSITFNESDIFMPSLYDVETYIGSYAIGEYLEKSTSYSQLWIFWISTELFCAFSNLLKQRLFAYFKTPFSKSILQYARNDLNTFFKKANSMFQNIQFIGNDHVGSTDLLLASLLSYLDYLNEVQWKNFEHLKLWYSTIKSRPCFHSILSDQLPGIKPSIQYTKVDF